MTLCRHCRRNKLSNSGRGLCRRCWDNPQIRNRYRPKIDRAPRLGNLSEAELDALIREQLKPENLPEWWEKETRRLRELEQAR